MLDERFGLYRVLISAFMLCGVVLITRPPFLFPDDPPVPANGTFASNATSHTPDIEIDPHQTLGYIAAIFVPILSAIVSIWTRQCRQVTASVLMFWFAVGAFTVAAGGMFSLCHHFHPRARRAKVSTICRLYSTHFIATCHAFVGICIGRYSDIFNLTGLEVAYTFIIVALGMIGNLSYTFAVR